MIINFKIFESISKPYKVGDYILIKIESKGILYNNLLCEIISDELSDIKIKILNNDNFKHEYLIRKQHIICWSESKEELEQILLNNKFNL